MLKIKNSNSDAQRLRIYFESQTDIPVSYSLKMLIRRAVLETLKYEGVESDCEVSVTFTDNEGIHALNKEYRNIEVLSNVEYATEESAEDFEIAE